MNAKMKTTKNTRTAGISSRQSRREREEPSGPAAVVQIRIELRRISPRIWRRVLVPADCTLGRLHAVIQAAMGWSDDHLHEFVVDGTTYGSSNPDSPDEDDGGLDEEGVTLAGLGLRTGRRLYYDYDFGDSWEHLITVQRLIVPAPNGWKGVPRCIAGARACPPEDCGGFLGYSHALEILAAPERELDVDDHAFKEWLGTSDPERFDLERVNRRLASV
jgi:hypothetical protein